MENRVELLKALADSNRLWLLELLLQHDLCVGALASQLNISESAVSQHLKVLREAELVRGEKRGYFTHYTVEREMLDLLAREIARLADLSPTPVSTPLQKQPEKCATCRKGD